MLPNGSFQVAPSKVVDLRKVGDEQGTEIQSPPMSAARFQDALEPKVFRGEPGDAKVVARLYRQLIEDGFNGLTKLCYRGQGWEDETLYELATTLKQAPCEHLIELDLSHNAFTTNGLESLAEAVQMGALSALRILNLSHCPKLVTLPEAMTELMELQVLRIEGCVYLKTLPQGLIRMAIKELYVYNCHALIPTIPYLQLPTVTTVIQTEAASDDA